MFAGTETRVFHCGRCKRKEQKRRYYWGDVLGVPVTEWPAKDRAGKEGRYEKVNQSYRDAFFPTQNKNGAKNVGQDTSVASAVRQEPRRQALGLFAEDMEVAQKQEARKDVSSNSKKRKKKKKRKRRRIRRALTLERKSRRRWSKAADSTWQYLEFFTDEETCANSSSSSESNWYDSPEENHHGAAAAGGEGGGQRRKRNPARPWWEPQRSCERCSNHHDVHHSKWGDQRQQDHVLLLKSPNSETMRKHAETMLMRRILGKREDEERRLSAAAARARSTSAADDHGRSGCGKKDRSAPKSWEKWWDWDDTCRGCRKHHDRAESARATPRAEKVGVEWLLRQPDCDRSAMASPGAGAGGLEAGGVAVATTVATVGYGGDDDGGDCRGLFQADGYLPPVEHGANVLSPSERFANKWKEKNLSLRWWEPETKCKNCMKHHRINAEQQLSPKLNRWFEVDTLPAGGKDGTLLLEKTTGNILNLDIYLPPGDSHAVDFSSPITENDAKIKNRLKPINTAREAIHSKVTATLPCMLHSKHILEESVEKAKASHALYCLGKEPRWWESERKCAKCLYHHDEKSRRSSSPGKSHKRRQYYMSVKFRQLSKSPTKRRKSKRRTLASPHMKAAGAANAAIMEAGKDGNPRKSWAATKHVASDCKRCSRHHEACALLMDELAKADLVGRSPSPEDGGTDLKGTVEKHNEPPTDIRKKEGQPSKPNMRKAYKFNPLFSPPEMTHETNYATNRPDNCGIVRAGRLDGISLTSTSAAQATAPKHEVQADELRTAMPSGLSSMNVTDQSRSNQEHNKNFKEQAANAEGHAHELCSPFGQNCPCISLCREVGVQVILPVPDEVERRTQSRSHQRFPKNPWPELQAPPSASEVRNLRIKELQEEGRKALMQRKAERQERILRSSQEVHEKQLRQALHRAPRIAPVGYEWRDTKQKFFKDGDGRRSPPAVISSRPLHKLKFNVWGSGPDRPINATSGFNTMRRAAGEHSNQNLSSEDSPPRKNLRRRRREDTKVRIKRQPPKDQGDANSESTSSSGSDADRTQRLFKGRYAGPSKRVQRKLCKSDHRIKSKLQHTPKLESSQQDHNPLSQTPKSSEDNHVNEANSVNVDVVAPSKAFEEVHSVLRIEGKSQTTVTHPSGSQKPHLISCDEAPPNPVLHDYLYPPYYKGEPSVASKPKEGAQRSLHETTHFESANLHNPTHEAVKMEGSRPWCSIVPVSECMTGPEIYGFRKKTKNPHNFNVPKLDLRSIKEEQHQLQTPAPPGSHDHNATAQQPIAAASTRPTSVAAAPRALVPSMMSCFGAHPKKPSHRGSRRELDLYLSSQSWSSSRTSTISTIATSTMKSEVSKESPRSTSSLDNRDQQEVRSQNNAARNSSGANSTSTPVSLLSNHDHGCEASRQEERGLVVMTRTNSSISSETSSSATAGGGAGVVNNHKGDGRSRRRLEGKIKMTSADHEPCTTLHMAENDRSFKEKIEIVKATIVAASSNPSQTESTQHAHDDDDNRPERLLASLPVTNLNSTAEDKVVAVEDEHVHHRAESRRHVTSDDGRRQELIEKTRAMLLESKLTFRC